MHQYYETVNPRRAIVHIGAPKTGTTTIQSFLFVNRFLLAQQGFHMPNIGGANHFSLPVLTYDETYWNDLCAWTALRLGLPMGRPSLRSWKQTLRVLHEELRTIVESCTEGTLILTNEHLYERLETQDQVNRFIGLLHELGLDIQIVVYVREPLGRAISEWNTAVKSGIHFDPLVLPEAGLPVELSRLGKDQWTDTPDPVRASSSHISLWETAMPDRVKVRLFDAAMWPDGNLLKDFCDAVGIEWMKDFIQPEPVNESLSWSKMKVLNRVNAGLPRLLPDGSIDISRARIWLLLEKLSAHPTKYQPTKREHDSYSKVFANSDEWIRASYFPDLDELWSSRTPIRSPDSDQLFSLELSEDEEKFADFLLRIWPLVQRHGEAKLNFSTF